MLLKLLLQKLKVFKVPSVYASANANVSFDWIRIFLGKTGEDLVSALSHLTAKGKEPFIHCIQKDSLKATHITNEADLKFDDPLTAVYHFRKHGAEFPDAIKQFGNGIQVYLGNVKNDLFNESNLRQVHTLSVSCSHGNL